MVQIFFFLSMLTIAVLMIQLFWYLEDSHRDEDRVSRSRNSARAIRQSNPGVYDVNSRSVTAGVSADFSTYRSSRVKAKNHTSANPYSNQFFDVGTESETSLEYSLSMNQDQCA